MESILFPFEERLEALAVILKKDFPSVGIYETMSCPKCGIVGRAYPLYDSTSGLPKTAYQCTLYTLGDGNSDAMDGGVIPLAGEVKDFGHGYFMVSIHLRINKQPDLEALSAAVLGAAEDLARLERDALGKAA